MTQSQIFDTINDLVFDGYPIPIIGGSCSLFLQGFNVDPNDIDLYYNIPKEDFLKSINYKRLKDYEVKLDWGFYPNMSFNYIELDNDNPNIRIQPAEEVINYKLDGLEESYFPEYRINKHLEFLNSIKDSELLSDKIKSRILDVLKIFKFNYDNMFTVNVEMEGKKVQICPKTGNVTVNGKPADFKIDPKNSVANIMEEIAAKLGVKNEPKKGTISLHDALEDVKEKLKDAPVEVKASFNNIVKHLDEHKSDGSKSEGEETPKGGEGSNKNEEPKSEDGGTPHGRDRGPAKPVTEPGKYREKSK